MSLEQQILSDYGTIPQTIGLFLLKNNTSTLQKIKDSIELSETQIRDGLAILIQRRFVKFFIFEKSIKYFFDRCALKRRLYFPVYLKFVSENYSSKYTKLFMQILVHGIYKEQEENEITATLLKDGILQQEVAAGDIKSRADSENFEGKIRKVSTKYLIVNYYLLDQKIYECEMMKYIRKRYNESAAEVLKSILKCDKVNKTSIINNLESTKILVSDNNTIINDKENINEYLKYLCCGQIIHKGYDENRAYFFDSCTRSLKIYKINCMFKSLECRRLFNMIASRKEIEDKDIIVYSLLGVNRIKTATLMLQRLGLVIQRCVGEYKQGTRVEHAWVVDIECASRSIVCRMECIIEEKLKNINGSWDVNYFMDNADGNENVWYSDFISLCTDHLILSME